MNNFPDLQRFSLHSIALTIDSDYERLTRSKNISRDQRDEILVGLFKNVLETKIFPMGTVFPEYCVVALLNRLLHENFLNNYSSIGRQLVNVFYSGDEDTYLLILNDLVDFRIDIMDFMERYSSYLSSVSPGILLALIIRLAPGNSNRSFPEDLLKIFVDEIVNNRFFLRDEEVGQIFCLDGDYFDFQKSEIPLFVEGSFSLMRTVGSELVYCVKELEKSRVFEEAIQEEDLYEDFMEGARKIVAGNYAASSLDIAQFIYLGFYARVKEHSLEGLSVESARIVLDL